ncbi:MAG TPA: TMEM175 family protein [Chitinophagaceae bacterium]|jgi:uncharacterized membrane protein|nr:TMEM175 family protein [Chitinophagaceae bacterium]
MNNQIHNELKKEFQLERMILFSDAVFAIAITLLVIEIKIPEIENVSDKVLLQALGHLIPKFVGFLISFIFIGLYWTIHHRMFGFVTSYNRKLIFLNLLFLFFIALMPFSTGFYSEYAGKLARNQLTVPLTFYVLNFCGIGFVNYFMWRYVSNPKHKLTEPPIEPFTLKFAKLRALTVPIIFLLMIPVAYFINVMIAVYLPMLIPVTLRILKKTITRKYKIVQHA